MDAGASLEELLEHAMNLVGPFMDFCREQGLTCVAIAGGYDRIEQRDYHLMEYDGSQHALLGLLDIGRTEARTEVLCQDMVVSMDSDTE
jgi:hypothetical protein